MSSAEEVSFPGSPEPETAPVSRLQLVRLQEEPEASPPLNPFQTALVEGHMHVVDRAVKHARHIRRRGLDTEEAHADASEGLCDAARRFDPTRQVTFEAFAAGYSAQSLTASGGFTVFPALKKSRQRS